jgi:hypothetical protein
MLSEHFRTVCTISAPHGFGPKILKVLRGLVGQPDTPSGRHGEGLTKASCSAGGDGAWKSSPRSADRKGSGLGGETGALARGAVARIAEAGEAD